MRMMQPGMGAPRGANHPPHQAPARIDREDRVLFAVSGALLSITFITGGSLYGNGWGVMFAELLALATLLLVLSVTRWRTRIGAAPWTLSVAVLIIAIPALQLVPIPAWLWELPAPRLALQHDLASAGIAHINRRWSLAPAATERDLYLLLPALALFVATQALHRRAWYGLLWWIIGLVTLSVVLGVVQMGVPRDSFLNPFPQYEPSFSGVFANRDHQACALAIGLVVAVALLVDARRRVAHRARDYRLVFVYAVIAVLMALILPLTGSRGGVTVAMIGVAVAMLALRAESAPNRPHPATSRLFLAAAVAVLAIGLYSGFAWMRHIALTGALRPQMAHATAQLAVASMPLGGGVGSFVRMFEQFTRGSLMHYAYVNVADNDYLQWWYAGGALAIIAMVGALAVLVTATLRLLRLPRASRLRGTGMAALLAVLVPVLHSTVDCPLRTPALMTVFATLAGIAVAAGARAKQRLAAPKAIDGAAPADSMVGPPGHGVRSSPHSPDPAVG